MTISENIRKLLKEGRSTKDIQKTLGLKRPGLIYYLKKKMNSDSSPSFDSPTEEGVKKQARSVGSYDSEQEPETSKNKGPTVFKVEEEAEVPQHTEDTSSSGFEAANKDEKERLEKKFKIKFEYISSAGPAALNNAFEEYGLSPLTKEERDNEIDATNDALAYYLKVYSKYAIWINLGFAYGMPFITRLPEILKLRKAQQSAKKSAKIIEPANAPVSPAEPERTIMGARIDARGHLLENPLAMARKPMNFEFSLPTPPAKKNEGKNGDSV